MTPKRRAHLIQRCHDTYISIEAEMRCGKRIPDLTVIILIFKILEEILKDE